MPQLAGSVEVLTQTEPQTVWPVGQLVRQTPAVQTCPALHAMPQPPQLAGSLCVLTQTEPHAVWPVGHEMTQRPPEHTWPELHAVPHMPQLARSPWRSAQTPTAPDMHAVCPSGHDTRHAPA